MIPIFSSILQFYLGEKKSDEIEIESSPDAKKEEVKLLDDKNVPNVEIETRINPLTIFRTISLYAVSIYMVNKFNTFPTASLLIGGGLRMDVRFTLTCPNIPIPASLCPLQKRLKNLPLCKKLNDLCFKGQKSIVGAVLITLTH